MNDNPIGVFDSGMGGLTVRAELARQLPGESLIYFGDGKNVPYGPRSKEEITGFVDRAVGLLIDKGVKMIVIACNAATGAAIEFLRSKYNVPMIGMEPAVKPAALASKSGIVGVLATAAAFKGELYKTTAAKYRGQVRIIETVGEGFVELVENDMENTPEAFETVRRAVEPMIEAGADQVVLGCTHYPFLAPVISRIIGSRDVQLVDSASAIARRVDKLLTENGLKASHGHEPHHEFLTFGDENYQRHLIDKSAKVPPVNGFLEKYSERRAQ